ncbi:MAG: hypothetical protein N3A58_05830 [Spirochaetes bacterium]|nr:hypothetical protein [Spirochaetota bacterium]
MGIFILFKAELMKYILELKRYFFNFIFNVLIISAIFLAFLFGIKFVTAGNIDYKNLDSFIIGYILWLIILDSFASISYAVSNDMQRGTFEQLFLCKYGIEIVYLFNLILNIVYTIFLSLIVLYFFMFISGRWIKIPFSKIILPLFLSIPSVWGLGFIFAGFAIIYKKISSFLNLMQFILIIFVSLPAYPLNFFSFLPFTAGASTIQGIINNNMSFSALWYLFLLIISVLYFSMGIIIFKKFLKKGRKLNLLGQY